MDLILLQYLCFEYIGVGSLFRCPWWTRTSILTRLIPKDASSQSKGLNTQNGKLCAGILQNSIGTHNAYGRTSLRFYAILNLVTLKFRFWVRSPVLNFSTGTARRRKVALRRKVAQEKSVLLLQSTGTKICKMVWSMLGGSTPPTTNHPLHLALVPRTTDRFPARPSHRLIFLLHALLRVSSFT